MFLVSDSWMAMILTYIPFWRRGLPSPSLSQFLLVQVNFTLAGGSRLASTQVYSLLKALCNITKELIKFAANPTDENELKLLTTLTSNLCDWGARRENVTPCGFGSDFVPGVEQGFIGTLETALPIESGHAR
ncbi:hypothetical protein BC835DRAFT_1304558 [Cytidiella melzeri]|nr:hypothetical protein BC835DRAFT_1304558 [Cytidiella melzeri]